MSYAFFSNPEDGTKALACPHCGRILEVDIDDILPVHSRKTHIHIDVDRGRIETPNPTDDLCEGSWNVTGASIKFEIWRGGPFKKANNDTP
jgi:hypothetical protein